MADESHSADDEMLSLEAGSEPQPVPVPPPGETGSGPQPVPVPPPSAKPLEEEPISLVSEKEVHPPSSATPIKRVAGAAARGLSHKVEFNHSMNLTGQGATRVRLFYSKIADGPLLHMETLINDWIDEEGIEVKHVGQVIGTLEGKHADPNLILSIWY